MNTTELERESYRAEADHLAEFIGQLTSDDAEKLWSIVIQLKPYLND